MIGLDATAFVSPVIVTEDVSAAARFESASRVTVIVLVPPAIGLLWPIFRVVKLAALTTESPMLNIKNAMMRKDLQ